MTEFKQVVLDLIDPNPYQIRESIEVDGFEGLVESIKNDPLKVRNAPLLRPVKARYQTASGHRRIAAARKAGDKTVWCRIEKLSDEDMMKEVLVENAHRQDLKPRETYKALEQYRKKLGLTKDFYSELSRRTSLTDAWIRNIYDAFNLLPKLKIERVLNEEGSEPSVTTIHATVGLEEKDRIKLIEKADEEDWSSRKVLEVKSAIKDMEPSLRKSILEKDVHLTPKTITTLKEKLPDSEVASKVIAEIKARELNEEGAIKMIERVATGTQPQIDRIKNDVERVMEDLQNLLIEVKQIGLHQYMILGDVHWTEAENIFTQIELHMKWLKRKGWEDNIKNPLTPEQLKQMDKARQRRLEKKE